MTAPTSTASDDPLTFSTSAAVEVRQAGALDTGATVTYERFEPGGWGIAVRGPGLASMEQREPIRIELHQDDELVTVHSVGYHSIEQDGEEFVARGQLAVGDATFVVEDRWAVQDTVLSVTRVLRVAGSAPGGFLSAITLDSVEPMGWSDVRTFAPGMMYGSPEHLTGVAIGGLANFLAGVTELRIREDRLPAPMFGLAFGDGTSVTTLDTAPAGDTTVEDANDTDATTMVDERFRFGALGGYESARGLTTGYWFPGTEGEATYRGDQFPRGQMRAWRRRYHPVRDGLEQRYQVAFRFGRDERFQDVYTAGWRWAWNVLQPQIAPQDIEASRYWSTEVIANHVVTASNGRAGVVHVIVADTGEIPTVRYRALMGFTGRSVESAYFLLRGAERERDEAAARYRELGLAVLESFASLPMSPPAAEGFTLDKGEPVVGRDDLIHLRSLAEGGKYMLRSWQRERDNGHDHPRWKQWSVDLGNWLLSQERPGGGLPRTLAADGSVASESTYEAVPFLVELSQATGEQRYLDAAIRAGNYCWANGHNRGYFVGGTIDNPNVIDKEAGTMSLEAYLALYEVTQDTTWLQRAVAAANFAETWIYCWDVPMPADADPADLGWKPGVTTVGLQLIASGHSLVDAYMAWDVAAYARLHAYTGDEHYLDVARLLLHNTKTMLPLPGRQYDLAEPGLHQEHWSLAPRRGNGIHRYWLPWVSCSHLEGIYALQDFDAVLFAGLAAEEE